MKIMDGKKIADRELSILKEEVKTRDKTPSLAVVQVGNDPVSSLYIKMKQKAGKKIGVPVSVYRFTEDISTEELQKEISLLEESGIIVQLPLPLSVDTSAVLNSVPAEKDVDMLSDFSAGKFYNNTTNMLPPLVGAVRCVLMEYKIKVKGAHVAIAGSGKLVGKPLFLYFVREGATVSMLNRSTKDLSSFTKKADIVVSGTGSPGVIKGDMIKKGAVVIDTGSSSDKGNVKGDVHRSSVEGKASFLAPVPGGVGPLTICCLIHNLLYER